MYDTEMIKDLETKFQSAALVELIKEPGNMLLVSQQLDTWRIVDELLQAEKEAYDQQYRERLRQLDVRIPSIKTASGLPFGMREVGLILGGLCAVGYIAYNLTPSAAARRAEAKAKKIAAQVKIRAAEQKREILEARHQKALAKIVSDDGGDESINRSSFKSSSNLVGRASKLIRS